MEWRQIIFAQRVFGNLRGVVIAAALSGAVADVVFCAGDDTVRGIKVFALITAHVGPGHADDGGCKSSSGPEGKAGDRLVSFLSDDVDVHFGRLAQEAMGGGEVEVFFPAVFDGSAKNDVGNVLFAYDFRDRVGHAQAF